MASTGGMVGCLGSDSGKRPRRHTDSRGTPDCPLLLKRPVQLHAGSTLTALGRALESPCESGPRGRCGKGGAGRAPA